MACNASSEWNTFIWLWSCTVSCSHSQSPLFLQFLIALRLNLENAYSRGSSFWLTSPFKKLICAWKSRRQPGGVQGGHSSKHAPSDHELEMGFFFIFLSHSLPPLWSILPQMQSKALKTFWTLTSLENQTSGWPPFNSNRGHIYFLIEDTNNDSPKLELILD